RTMRDRSWCLSCGWDSTAPEEVEVPETPPSLRPPVWAVVLLVGVIFIITLTYFRTSIMPRASWLLIWWIAIQGVSGILIYFAGHAWLLGIIVRDMKESDMFKYFHPTYIWKHAFEYLPRTRGSMILGAWGMTAFICAVVVFMRNDFS